MPRVMVVVVIVGVLVWALVFVDFGRPRVRRDAAAAEPVASTEAAVEPAASEPVAAPRPAPAAAVQRAIEVQPGAQKRADVTARQTVAAIDPSARPVSAAAPTDRPSTGALSTATGELGEGYLSPEYAEMERAYTHEPRDGEWAEAEEERLRAMLAATPFASAVGLVNCQETVCRLLFESDDNLLYDRLLASRAFTQATGLSRSSPYSHRSGQLSVYFQRRGSQ